MLTIDLAAQQRPTMNKHRNDVAGKAEKIMMTHFRTRTRRRRRRNIQNGIFLPIIACTLTILSKTQVRGLAPLHFAHPRRIRRLHALSKADSSPPKSTTAPESQQQQQLQPPIPTMPSDMFRQMAQSQLELLANSLSSPRNDDNPSKPQSKVQSMSLYLPAENVLTGQLEFTPAVLYPDPRNERVFIASDAASGQAPTLPRTLTKLPGFSHASTLLPGYPLLSSQSQPGVGTVEEVMCDIRFKTSALSVPLLSGSQTVGVLLVSPAVTSAASTNGVEIFEWTAQDREQVSRAAQSLSMALMMDNEKNILKEQNTLFRESLSDSLHQVKNPIQALRTYGKILQRQIADASKDIDMDDDKSGTPQLLELAERLMVQSERVVRAGIVPFDET